MYGNKSKQILKKTQIRPFVIEDEKRLVFLPDDNKKCQKLKNNNYGNQEV